MEADNRQVIHLTSDNQEGILEPVFVSPLTLSRPPLLRSLDIDPFFSTETATLAPLRMRSSTLSLDCLVYVCVCEEMQEKTELGDYFSASGRKQKGAFEIIPF